MIAVRLGGKLQGAVTRPANASECLLRRVQVCPRVVVPQNTKTRRGHEEWDHCLGVELDHFQRGELVVHEPVLVAPATVESLDSLGRSALPRLLDLERVTAHVLDLHECRPDLLEHKPLRQAVSEGHHAAGGICINTNPGCLHHGDVSVLGDVEWYSRPVSLDSQGLLLDGCCCGPVRDSDNGVAEDVDLRTIANWYDGWHARPGRLQHDQYHGDQHTGAAT
mmetsp:Transcript_46485/g.138948  ORF Transcript_46485/g.138948 Transcript_46485/m.138948 type:complete len:222 (-) Transcript_46485:64-729(-)